MPETFDVTLDNCHEEPIHIPGSVQPHGVLLVVDTDSWRIRFCSDNLQALTGLQIDTLLDNLLEDLIGEHQTHALQKAFAQNALHEINPLEINLASSPHPFEGVAGSSDRGLLLSLEPRAVLDHFNLNQLYFDLRKLAYSLTQSEELERVFNSTVREVRNITGFDRVMLYRFDAEYNGEVVAEDKRTDLNSFLNQHFPESDIPAQARALYVRNPIRLLADVNAEQSRIVPAGTTIDLSDCTLRSVSPIHRQYLRNMGVMASMSISIVVDDKLWGLIACHHYQPHTVSFQIREAALHIALLLSHLITISMRTEVRVAEAKLKEVNARLMENMAQETDFMEGLKSNQSLLLELVNADGVAWKLNGHLECFGITPEPDQVQEIVDWVHSQAPSQPSVYHTHALSEKAPGFEDLHEIASGILILPLSVSDNRFILWFRQEVEQTKNWGGKPEKHIEFQDDGSHRLMPRTSFKLWQENVRNHSLFWQESEISIALKFRNTVLNHLLLQAERLKKVNTQLEAMVEHRTLALQKEIAQRKAAQEDLANALQAAYISNKELEQFAFVASHDLQEPLRKIQTFSNRLEQTLKDNIDERSKSYLERLVNASGRMQLLIHELLNFSRISRSEDPFVDINLNELLALSLADLNILVEQKQATVTVGNLPTIKADHNQIYRLFLNLLQNSLKFTHPKRNPEISLELYEESADFSVIVLRDNGIGFNDKYKDRIFKLFERLHARTEHDGAGMGLAICRKIMDRHNGLIWAESEPGEGTQIFLRFPLHPGQQN